MPFAWWGDLPSVVVRGVIDIATSLKSWCKITHFFRYGNEKNAFTLIFYRHTIIIYRLSIKKGYRNLRHPLQVSCKQAEN